MAIPSAQTENDLLAESQACLLVLFLIMSWKRQSWGKHIHTTVQERRLFFFFLTLETLKCLRQTKSEFEDTANYNPRPLPSYIHSIDVY